MSVTTRVSNVDGVTVTGDGLGQLASGSGAPSPLDRRVRLALAGLLVARIGVNGGIRVVYPFLSVIAAGLGVSLQTIALLVATRSLAGLAGPLLAGLASPSRWNAMMLASPIVVGAGCGAIVIAERFPPTLRAGLLVVGFAATGLARPLFELPMQAWLTIRIPISKRGRAVGVTELGWGLSLAATVPAAGLLIDRGGWRYAFGVVIVLCVAGLAVTKAVVSPVVVETTPVRSAGPVRVASASPPASQAGDAIRLCAAAVLVVAAGEMLLVTHGAWLGGTFGLSATEIGVASVLIVAGELAGSLLVAAIADRLGVRRTLLGGLLLSSVTAVLLGAMVDTPGLAVIVIALWSLAFEVSVVTLVVATSLTDAGDRPRPCVLGWLMASIAIGNAIDAAIGPIVFADGNIGATGATAATLSLMAAVVLRRPPATR